MMFALLIPSLRPPVVRIRSVSITGARLGAQIAFVRLVPGSFECADVLVQISPLRGSEELLQFGAVQQEALLSRGSVCARSCPERTRRCSLGRLTSYLSAVSRILRNSASRWIYFMYVSM